MKYFHVSFCQLQEAVHQPTDRQRMFTSSCRKFIRAAAGHSIPVNLTNFAQSIDNPAQVWYCCHGTSLHAYSQIKEEGLKTDHTVYTLCIVQRTTKEEFGGSHNPQRQEVPTRRYVVVSSTRWKHCCYRKQKRSNKALFLPMRNN